jgi:hypothetical protein
LAAPLERRPPGRADFALPAEGFEGVVVMIAPLSKNYDSNDHRRGAKAPKMS